MKQIAEGEIEGSISDGGEIFEQRFCAIATVSAKIDIVGNELCANGMFLWERGILGEVRGRWDNVVTIMLCVVLL